MCAWSASWHRLRYDTMPSHVCLHALLQGSRQVRVLGRWVWMVWRGRRWGLAVLVKVRIAAGAAVALRVHEGTRVAEGGTLLQLALAQLNGAAACSQDEASSVFIQARVGRTTDGWVDVGKRHACGYSLLAGGGFTAQFSGGVGASQCDGGSPVVLFEGVYAVIAVGGILDKKETWRSINLMVICYKYSTFVPLRDFLFR